MGTFGGLHQRIHPLRRDAMTGPGPRAVRRMCGVVQPMLPLGSSEVNWDALPASVREDVLTRWCELLSLVAANQREDSLDDEAGDVEGECP
jgi:hypothetical protein